MHYVLSGTNSNGIRGDDGGGIGVQDVSSTIITAKIKNMALIAYCFSRGLLYLTTHGCD